MGSEALCTHKSAVYSTDYRRDSKEGGGSTSPAQGLVSTQIQINVLTLHPMSLLCSHLGNRNSQNKQLIKHVGLFSIVKGRERNDPGDTWHCEGT